jgi:DNA ligase (NAD+)
MNIEGLAEKQIQLFIEKGFIKDFSDIYKLKVFKKELLELEGYKKTSVNKLLLSIENSKKNSLENLIFGLGIRHIGKKTSLELAMNYNNLFNLAELSRDELLKKTNLGEVKTTSILE